MSEPIGITVTPEFRMLFPNLFEAKRAVINGKASGEPKFELSMLFEPEQVDELKKVAARVAAAKWPGRSLTELKFPFTSGEKLIERYQKSKPGRDYSFYQGKVVLRGSSKFKPGVVDANRNDILDAGAVYSGCYGFAEVNFTAYDGIGANPDGVTAYVNFVLKSRDGERIAARSAADVFAGVQGTTTQDDPTSGMDEDIPF